MSSLICCSDSGLRTVLVLKRDLYVGYFLLAFHNVIVYKVRISLGSAAFILISWIFVNASCQ